MTSRSIVFSTAALLLLSAATPVQLGFSPTAAVAQEVSAEVRAALTGDPAGLEAAQLSDRIRVLRDAIESGALKGPDRKAAQQKVKAYREVLKQLRGERKEARKETQQADQPAAGQRTQAQRGDQQAEQQQPRAQRQAQQQEQAQPQKQAQQQAQRPAQQQAQQQAQSSGESGLSEDARAALRDTRPAEDLPPDELRDRIQVLRGILQSAPLTQEQRSDVQARMQADRDVLRSRRDQRQQQAEPEQGQREQVQTQEAQPQQAQPEQAQTRQRQPRQSRAEAMPEAEVEQRAQKIMSDNTPSDDLDDEALRRRLTENRAVLETGKLSRAEVRELRQQLRADREELRSRVAAKQDAAEEDDKPASGATSSSTSTSTSSTEVNTTTNVNVIIEQQTPADRLTERDLERRVRALNRALKEERLARRDAEIAREIVERDRRELSRRLHADRDRRRDRWRDPRYRDEMFVEFNVGYRPPPVIFAAEAMPRDIEMQLVAPPARQMTRAYSMQEIASNQDVREMMPGIEIDTLNFDFGSAEVRPEEIDKLDAIAEVIERIVAARPDEVFLIEGHTDAVGSDAANDVLSQRRSQAVAEALLDYYAIDPENLQTVGLGEQYLKIWTEEPEEENRRVTIRRITPLLAGGQG